MLGLILELKGLIARLRSHDDYPPTRANPAKSLVRDAVTVGA